MLFLVVLTMLSIAMFRSFGLQEKIAGNTRDKQRAFEAAQSALQYGEWWLTQGTVGAAVACTGVVSGNTVSSMRVCSTPVVASPAGAWVPWANRIDYVPPSMTVVAGGGLTGSGADINYQGNPALSIYFMGYGTDPNGKPTSLYQISAFGYGGNADTVAVVQSTYQLSASTQCLDCL